MHTQLSEKVILAMPAVEVNRIVKSYADKIAVDDLSFSVNQGEIFGLIGPNGAGKATTIRMLMYYLTTREGGSAQS